MIHTPNDMMTSPKLEISGEIRCPGRLKGEDDQGMMQTKGPTQRRRSTRPRGLFVPRKGKPDAKSTFPFRMTGLVRLADVNKCATECPILFLAPQ